MFDVGGSWNYSCVQAKVEIMWTVDMFVDTLETRPDLWLNQSVFIERKDAPENLVLNGGNFTLCWTYYQHWSYLILSNWKTRSGTMEWVKLQHGINQQCFHTELQSLQLIKVGYYQLMNGKSVCWIIWNVLISVYLFEKLLILLVCRLTFSECSIKCSMPIEKVIC